MDSSSERRRMLPTAAEPSFRLPGLAKEGGDTAAPLLKSSMKSPTGSGALEQGTTGVSFRLSAVALAEGDEDDYSLDDSVGTDSTSGDGQKKKGKALDKTLANVETKAVRCLRLMIWSGLAITAIVFSVVTFWYARRQEVESFEEQFHELAEQFVNGFHGKIKLQLQTMDLLSISLTTVAVETNQKWPFVTINDWEALGTSARSMVAAPSLGMYPKVIPQLRFPWEQYTQWHSNLEWTNQSRAYQEYFEETFNRSLLQITNHQVYTEGDSADEAEETRRRLQEAEEFTPTTWNGQYGSNPSIYRTNPLPQPEIPYVNEPQVTTGPAYYPIWQMSPYLQDGFNQEANSSQPQSIRLINYNLKYSINTTLMIVEENGEAVFGHELWKNDDTTTANTQPGASILYPIFNTILEDSVNESKKVAGILELDFEWQSFFSYILPHSSNAIQAVISNCQQTYSYQITGEMAYYEGPNNLHQTEFDDLKLTAALADFQTASTGTYYNGVPVNQDYCPWTLEVYATQDMRDAFVTAKPFLYMVVVAVVFLWTCFIFLVYDWLVERRQRKVMQTAIKSDQIVSQLFPNTFRDALYEKDKKDEDQSERKSTATALGGNAFHADIVEEFKRSVGGNQEGANQPMARLYPNCTVFFADIAGFTAWSSARSPVQVFTLLETIYGTFDKIAHKRHVFKIETIGDCYVAVTGLPQPQPNHALLMVKFARDCLARMPNLLKKLATTLGPDTCDLAMRVGIHSGPVTAGVLRGEKARFQLFGDTVNTAARMESNGKKECIHASQETADILFASGKGHWVHPRGERIYAKGKGELQTFWVVPSSGESAMFDDSIMLEGEVDMDDDDDDSEADNKEARIIEAALEGFGGSQEEKAEKTKWAEKNFKSVGWVVDLLYWEVKGMAWERRRHAEIEVDDVWDDAGGLEDWEPDWNEDLQRFLFDLSNSTDQRGDKSWKVAPEIVRDQLTQFVLKLTLQYEDAAFHNFDHLCQVLISADKMLKQLTTILGRDRQLNSWAKFTLLLAVLIGDISPASFGLKRITESVTSSTRHKAAFQKSLNNAWNLLMEPKFKELRNLLCSNETELECFQQLLVNLVFAGDISFGEHMEAREDRWNAAFRNMEQSPTRLLHLQAGAVLEHVSIAAQWTHTMQIWETYKKWNSCMFQELCDSYEKGVIKKDPAFGWFQQELILFDKVILPMLERLQEANALGATGSELLKCATSNRRSWGRLFLSRT